VFKFGRYPLRLRFIGEEGGETEGTEVEPQGEVQPSAETGYNPAWEPIKSELDDISFHRIQPILKSYDQSASQRVTEANAKLAPFKEFIDAGITPEDMGTGLALVQRINDPEQAVQFYEALGSYLKDNGRLPNEAELVQEVKDNAAEQEPQADPRLDQIAQQQEAMAQFLQQQEYEKAVQKADSDLTQEQNALKAAHPELTDANVKEIIRQAAAQAQMTGQVPSLAEVHDGWFTELRTQFLSTPRPGDSAPKLLPTSGGLPNAVPQKKLGELSRDETQDIIAGLIESNRG